MSQKKNLVSLIAFYGLIAVLGVICLVIGSVVLKMIPNQTSLGAMIMVIYAMVFACIPIMTGLLVRLTLCKWVVDPIAAAEIPVLLYVLMFVNQLIDGLPVTDALESANDAIVYFVLLFFFALLCTLSFARRKEKTIGYKLLRLLEKKR